MASTEIAMATWRRCSLCGTAEVAKVGKVYVVKNSWDADEKVHVVSNSWDAD